MPSGAKKRKAAKKKKETQNQSNYHTDSAPARTNGNEDVKHQDNRESNVGEFSSPTSQDHQKLPMEAEAAFASSAEGSRIDNGEEQVGVEKEFKIEDESGVKDGIIDRKPYDGGSSWTGSYGGSSSSDDESRGIKKGQAESSIASAVSVQTDDSLSGKPVDSLCDPLTAEAGDSIVESISAAMESHVLSQAAVSVAPRVLESALEENAGEKIGSVEERIFPSVEAYRNEEADVGSAERTPKILDTKECVAQENDDRSTSPRITPRVAMDNGVERVKDSVVTQPAVAASPYPVQKTSWKSCCGLFEVFSGSGE